MSDIRADFAERLRAAGITAVPAGGDALRLSLGRRSERVVEVGPALSAAAALDARQGNRFDPSKIDPSRLQGAVDALVAAVDKAGRGLWARAAAPHAPQGA